MSITDSEKTIKIIEAAEEVADKILVNQQELVVLDKKRQHSREALHEVERQSDKKVWISIGSILVKTPRDKAINMLKNDLVKIENDIERLKQDQKILVFRHRELEYSEPLPGANIKPLDPKVFEALKLS